MDTYNCLMFCYIESVTYETDTTLILLDGRVGDVNNKRMILVL